VCILTIENNYQTIGNHIV